MFLRMSFILSTGGRCLPQCMLGYTPPANTPCADTPGEDTPHPTPPSYCNFITKFMEFDKSLWQYLWLISTAELGYRFGLGLGFQKLWLHSIMQNLFPLTSIQIRIPFPNGYCTHFRDRCLSVLHTFQSGNPNQWKNPA